MFKQMFNSGMNGLLDGVSTAKNHIMLRIKMFCVLAFILLLVLYIFGNAVFWIIVYCWVISQSILALENPRLLPEAASNYESEEDEETCGSKIKENLICWIVVYSIYVFDSIF